MHLRRSCLHRTRRTGPTCAAAALAAAVLHAGAGARHPAVKLTEFLNEKAPYPQRHASTIAETAPGRLAAAWFGGTREGASDVGIWFARYDGHRWVEATEVADGRQPDGSRYPTWNPSCSSRRRGCWYCSTRWARRRARGGA